MHTDENGEFQEVKARFPDYGISGKLDLIMPDNAYLKDLGAKTPKSSPAGISDWLAWDIKETGTKQYDDMPDGLSKKYITQISLYNRWMRDNGHGKTKDCGFCI